MHPNKQLSQHFLQNHTIAQNIVHALDWPCDGTQPSVLEIGPGTGVLTQFLIQKIPIQHLYAIEVDPRMVALLQKNYPTLKAHILLGDFLQCDIPQTFSHPLQIIGNLPYHISGPIFFKILENRTCIEQVVCMIQKEVAQRITATAGNKTYGLLSVLLQAFYHVNYLFDVPAEHFHPPPKVTSAVIQLHRYGTTLPCDVSLFFKVVKTGFQYRRKMLRNALIQQGFNCNAVTPDTLQKRAEQLTVDDFILLTQQIQNATD